MERQVVITMSSGLREVSQCCSYVVVSCRIMKHNVAREAGGTRMIGPRCCVILINTCVVVQMRL